MRGRRVWFCIVFAMALVIRLGACAALGLRQTPEPGSDEAEYVRYASNLVDGKGYIGPEPGSAGDVPTAYLPPGLPVFYAAVFTAFGKSVVAVRLVQCVIGAASVLLLYWVARRSLGAPAAWTAAVMFAVYPIALFYTHELLTETLYVSLLLLLTGICVNVLAVRPGAWVAIGAGILLGLTALTRPTILFFLPFLGIWCLIVLHTWKAWAWAALIPVVAGAVIAPWSVHASRVYGRFVLIAPVGWTVLLQGNNRIVATDPVYAGYCVWYTDVPEYKHKFDGLNQVQREDVARDLAKQWLRENRDKIPSLLLAKAQRFWSPFLKQPNLWRRAVMFVSWGGVLALAAPAFVLTLVRSVRRRCPLLFLHLFIAAVFAQALIYFALPRYRYPMEPFCIVLAATTLVYVVNLVLGQEFRAQVEPLPQPLAGAR